MNSLNKNKYDRYDYISISLIIIIPLIFHYQIYHLRYDTFNLDDYYSYYLKSLYLKFCFFDTCDGIINLFEQAKNNLSNNELNHFDRHIHRLTLSYTPLYSIIQLIFIWINNLNFSNIFILFIVIFNYSLIFLFSRYYLSSKETVLLLLFLIFHIPLEGPALIIAFPFISAVILSALSINYFNNKKIFLFLIFFSILLHKIALITSFLVILSYYFNDFIKNFLEKNYPLNLRHKFKEFFIFSLSIIFAYFLGFNFLNMDTSLISYYENPKSLLDLPQIMYNNYITLITSSALTLILFNPISIILITRNLSKNNDSKLQILKIFFVFLILTSIFFPLGLPFIIGNRCWNLILIISLILILKEIFNYKYFLSKTDVVKKIFIFFIPIFILFNFLYFYKYFNLLIEYQNFYVNKKVENIFDKNQQNKVYFDTDENFFYKIFADKKLFLNKNNYFKELYPDKNLTNQVNYIIINNPINIKGSDLLLTKDSVLKFEDTNLKEITILSKKINFVNINGNQKKLEKGVVKIDLPEETNINIFANESYVSRIIGIKFYSNQINNWPWGKDYSFKYSRDTFIAPGIKLYENIEKQFKFKNFFQTKFSDYIKNNIISEKCDFSIYDDRSSIIVLKNNC